jgi:hypothetical protein
MTGGHANDTATEDYLPGAIGGPAWGFGQHMKHHEEAASEYRR